VEKVKTETDSIWADMAQEHVPYWSLVVLIYKLESLIGVVVMGVSYHYHLNLNKTDIQIAFLGMF
jgi:hypothetical protein